MGNPYVASLYCDPYIPYIVTPYRFLHRNQHNQKGTPSVNPGLGRVYSERDQVSQATQGMVGWPKTCGRRGVDSCSKLSTESIERFDSSQIDIRGTLIATRSFLPLATANIRAANMRCDNYSKRTHSYHSFSPVGS